MAALELSVYRISGADRASFLQGQLTQDIQQLVPGSVLLSGYCNPQGRLLAVPIFVRPNETQAQQLGSEFEKDDWLMLLTKETAEAIIKRLTMFVMRADVQFSAFDCSIKSGDREGAGNWQLKADNGLNIHLPYAGTITLAANATASDAEACDLSSLFAKNSMPQIHAATEAEFIPQTVNLDALNAISFNKGCYTGQEIVARLHFRGQVKRRMQSVLSSVELQPGQPVLNAAGEKVGMVVLTSTLDAGEQKVLACIRNASIDEPLTSDSGQQLSIMTLPYELPA